MSGPRPIAARSRAPAARWPGLIGVLVAVVIGLLVLAPTSRAPARPAGGGFLSGLRLIDYFPAADGWGSMWSKWSAERTETDFARVAALHANCVRIVVDAPTFGFPRIDPVMLARLRRTIRLASKAGLRVELTLFNGWEEYRNLAASRSWARQLLGGIAGSDLAYIDLHNELPAATDPPALRWARRMIPFVQARDDGVPVTVSTSISSGVEPLRSLIRGLGSSAPDLYDVHYYGNAADAFAVLRQAKHLAGRVPLFIGETGFATDPSYGWAEGLPATRRSLDSYQDYYFRMVEYSARALGLPAASPWILYDMPGQGDTRWGHHMGILRSDGKPKPAGATLSRFFSGRPLGISFNNGFEHYSGKPALPSIWRRWMPGEAHFSLDSRVAHSGRASARIDGAGGDHRVGCPAYYAAPISAVKPGTKYTATAWARGRRASGLSRVVLVWSAAGGRYVGSSTSPLLGGGTTGWSKLQVSAQPPKGAKAVEVDLQVCENPGTTWFDDVTFSPVKTLRVEP